VPNRVTLKQTFTRNEVLQQEHEAGVQLPALLKGLKKTRGRMTEFMEQRVQCFDEERNHFYKD